MAFARTQGHLDPVVAEQLWQKIQRAQKVIKALEKYEEVVTGPKTNEDELSHWTTALLTVIRSHLPFN